MDSQGIFYKGKVKVSQAVMLARQAEYIYLFLIVGTTVALQNLFWHMPVRHIEFLRNIKKEFSMLVSVVSGYALVSEGVRIMCFNQVRKGKRSTVVVVATRGRSVKENLLAVFVAKHIAMLMPFRQADGEVSEVGREEGWVSNLRYGEVRGAPELLQKPAL